MLQNIQRHACILVQSLYLLYHNFYHVQCVKTDKKWQQYVCTGLTLSVAWDAKVPLPGPWYCTFWLIDMYWDILMV